MRTLSRRAIVVGGAAWVLAACSFGQAGKVAYGVGVSGDGNLVELTHDAQASEATYVATVQSGLGIGQANVAWWGITSPHQLLFELQLNGLEQFNLVWADQSDNRINRHTLQVSINSIDQSVTQMRQIDNQGEVATATDSPFWMAVLLPTAERNSYLIHAPPAFITAGPRLWSISWIDFYR